MPYLLVRQKVEDFDKWYAVFEAHAETQKNSGLRDPQVLIDFKDPRLAEKRERKSKTGQILRNKAIFGASRYLPEPYANVTFFY